MIKQVKRKLITCKFCGYVSAVDANNLPKVCHKCKNDWRKLPQRKKYRLKRKR